MSEKDTIVERDTIILYYQILCRWWLLSSHLIISIPKYSW